MSDNDGGYGNKVIAEYKKLKDVANGKNVPIYNTTSTASAPSAVSKPAVIKVTDKLTESRAEPERLSAI